MNQVLLVGLGILVMSVIVYMLFETISEGFQDYSASNASNASNYIEYNSNKPVCLTNNVRKSATLEGSVCSPMCCLPEHNSGLSCDRGCVCMSDEQKHALLTRGGNRKCAYE
jgi:hypothetical protein